MNIEDSAKNTQGDIFPMEIATGKCPIEAGGNCPLKSQGEWILNKDENPECPFCHHSFTYWGNFCGNCGADMRKGGAE